jgi:hypothetical protein
MGEYTVIIAIPHELEDDTCRIVRVPAQNLTQVFEQIEPDLKANEYVHHITLRVSEEDPALEVWHYIEGQNGYASYN